MRGKIAKLLKRASAKTPVKDKTQSQLYKTLKTNWNKLDRKEKGELHHV